MPKKLLSLNTYHYRRGGSEAVFFEHNTMFEQLGWEVAPFAQHHPLNDPSPWSEYFSDEMEFSEAKGIKDKIHMAGKFIYSWEARNKLEKMLDKFSPDIAHGHLLYHHLSPSVMSLLHKRGVPTVMTAHDLKLACPAYTMLSPKGVCEQCKGGNLSNVIKNRCMGGLVQSTLVALESTTHRMFGLWKNNLDMVVAPSQFYLEKLVEWGWPRDKIIYIANYIKPDEFQPQFEPGKYFLYFGRLANQKGVTTLIRAALESNIPLKIAGTGPQEDELKQLAKEAGNIEFLGHRSGADLHQLIREARAVVLPSEWYENAPISLLEALASGKPIIGADIGGIPEMVKEGETGWLFPSGNSDALAKILETANTTPASRFEAMGRQGRDFVVERFTADNYKNKMQDLYQALMK